MKSWTYREATSSAESTIKSIMGMAEAEEDPGVVRLMRSRAYGVYYGWSQLTMGWQNEGDAERLEKMTECHQ